MASDSRKKTNPNRRQNRAKPILVFYSFESTPHFFSARYESS